MAGEVFDVAKFLARGQVAETLMKELGEKVSQLRAKVVANEVQRLTRENEELALECEAWKQRLIKAEIRNGKRQFSVPVRNFSSKAGPTETPTETKVETSTQESPVGPPKEKKTNVKKEAKPSKNPPKENPQNAKSDDSVCVSQLDLRVGLITHVEKHPDADALYLEQIDVGEAKPRTIVSGLVKFVPLEQMRNRPVVVMCNLKPAKMRGVLSEGMVMCASTPDKVEPIRPPSNATPGDLVTWTGLSAEGYPNPETVLNPKKKIWERIAPDLKANAEGKAVWKGKLLEVRGKGNITADSLKDCQIK